MPWHQDRSIPVGAESCRESRIGTRTKGGIEFYQPDVKTLGSVLAVRLHLDRITINNRPLKVLLGTHDLGILSASEIAKLS